MEISDILVAVLYPLAKMGAIIACSYLVFKFQFVSYSIHNLLSKSVLYVTLPMLLVAELIIATDLLDKYPDWYWLPVIAIAVMCVSGAIGRFIAGLTLNKKQLMTIQKQLI